MNYPLVIMNFRVVIQDSSWDGPDKVNCPTVTSVGWLVERDDPVKLAGTLDDEGNPCAILAVPRGRCLLIRNCHMKLPPQKIPLTSDFHDALMAAKNKAHVIDIFCHRAGQHGWFNDMPEGL